MPFILYFLYSHMQWWRWNTWDQQNSKTTKPTGFTPGEQHPEQWPQNSIPDPLHSRSTCLVNRWIAIQCSLVTPSWMRRVTLKRRLFNTRESSPILCHRMGLKLTHKLKNGFIACLIFKPAVTATKAKSLRFRHWVFYIAGFYHFLCKKSKNT